MRQILASLAFAVLASAQIPHVGDINFYGLHKITPEKILSVTHLSRGSSLPASKGDLEEAIENIGDVVQGRVQAICCDGRSAALFIGIEERGAPHAAFRSAPAGETALPGEILTAHQQFLSAVARAAVRGVPTEDLTSGHSVMDDPAARALQSTFVTFASAHVTLLRDALHSCSEADQRAVAATVVGYAPPSQAIINDLQYALDDPDAAVRANAIVSLKAFAVYASLNPQAGLKIQPTWFVELLHSVELSDRTESTKALLLMTDHGGQSTIDLIREHAVPDLAEMARWPTLRYALSPFLLIGRVAGLPDAETQAAWQKNGREAVIEKALGPDSTKRGRK